MIKTIINGIDRINSIMEKISVALMIFLLFLTFANVLGRYLLQSSIYFADELARFIFVWIVFLGIAAIVRDKRQVAVSLLTDRLKGSVPGYILELVISALGLIFLIIVFIGGIQLSGTMNFYSSAALGIPMGYVYLAVPVGIGLTIIFHILNLVELLTHWFSGNKEIQEEVL